MLRKICATACLAFALLAASCANPPAPTPAADTRETDIQAVRDVESAYLSL